MANYLCSDLTHVPATFQSEFPVFSAVLSIEQREGMPAGKSKNSYPSLSVAQTDCGFPIQEFDAMMEAAPVSLEIHNCSSTHRTSLRSVSTTFTYLSQHGTVTTIAISSKCCPFPVCGSTGGSGGNMVD